MSQQRIIISALSGGGGKTLTTLGLCRAFLSRAKTVIPFKKGPDYIDTTWLSLAAKKNAYNLDPFFLSKEELIDHFLNIYNKVEAENNPLAIIEGNRGLYDGKDVLGRASTAELAVTLEAPVVLVIDTKKATRTLAALVNGMTSFDKRVSFAGIIFNNIASKRHQKIITETVSHYCDAKILGFIPRLEKNPIPERHLGLLLDPTNQENDTILNSVGEIISEYVDLDAIEKAVKNLPILESSIKVDEKAVEEINSKKTKIAYIKDKAIWFYYTENFEALEDENAELIPISLFDEESIALLDEVVGLYIGGGFPEVYAEEIAQSKLLQKISEKAEDNMPIYAECGGFMLLTHSLTCEDETHKMANIFPVDLQFYKKPQGLGYVEAEVIRENPYFSTGLRIKAHEFHYSQTLAPLEKICNIHSSAKENTFLFKLEKGVGMGDKKDALLYKNVFASYTHIYALEQKGWARNFIALANDYRSNKA